MMFGGIASSDNAELRIKFNSSCAGLFDLCRSWVVTISFSRKAGSLTQEMKLQLGSFATTMGDARSASNLSIAMRVGPQYSTIPEHKPRKSSSLMRPVEDIGLYHL